MKNKKPQTKNSPTDELHKKRVAKFIREETDKMKAGKNPDFPMSRLIKMDRQKEEAEHKNQKEAKKS